LHIKSTEQSPLEPGQLVKKISHVMEPSISLPFLQQPNTSPYPEPELFNSRFSLLFLENQF